MWLRLATCFLSVWLTTANDARWREISDVGAAPTPRQWMRAVFATSTQKVYTFGGGSYSTVSTDNFGDLLEYDASTGAWTNLTGSSSSQPGNRHGHGMVYDGDDGIWIFGGLQWWGATNDLYYYKISTDTWSNLTAGDSPGVPSGDGPQKKVWGEMVYVGGSEPKIYTFGGATSEGTGDPAQLQISGDFWEYTISSNSWSQIALTGQAASLPLYPRCQAGLLHVNSQGTDYLVLFGGFYFAPGAGAYFNDLWTYDLSTGTWAYKTPSGTAPSQRVGFGMAQIPYSDEDQVVVFGGLTYAGYDNDIFAYSMLYDAWTLINPSGSDDERPPARCCFAFPKASYGGSVGDQVFAITGTSGTSVSDNRADVMYSFAVPIPTTSTTTSSSTKTSSSTTRTTTSATVTSTSETSSSSTTSSTTSTSRTSSSSTSTSSTTTTSSTSTSSTSTSSTSTTTSSTSTSSTTTSSTSSTTTVSSTTSGTTTSTTETQTTSTSSTFTVTTQTSTSTSVTTTSTTLTSTSSATSTTSSSTTSTSSTSSTSTSSTITISTTTSSTTSSSTTTSSTTSSSTTTSSTSTTVTQTSTATSTTSVSSTSSSTTTTSSTTISVTTTSSVTSSTSVSTTESSTTSLTVTETTTSTTKSLTSTVTLTTTGSSTSTATSSTTRSTSSSSSSSSTSSTTSSSTTSSFTTSTSVTATNTTGLLDGVYLGILQGGVATDLAIRSFRWHSLLIIALAVQRSL